MPQMIRKRKHDFFDRFYRYSIVDNVEKHPINDDPFFSKANQDYILKSVKELREGKGQVHELIEVDDE